MAEQATFKCMRCGHEFRVMLDTDIERMCPKCRSNSIRRVKERPAPAASMGKTSKV